MSNPEMLSKVIKEFNGKMAKPLLTKMKMRTNVHYPIRSAQRKKTSFGTSLALELQEYILYLPERYSTLDDAAIDMIKDNNFSILKKDDNNLYLELNKVMKK